MIHYTVDILNHPFPLDIYRWYFSRNQNNNSVLLNDYILTWYLQPNQQNENTMKITVPFAEILSVIMKTKSNENEFYPSAMISPTVDSEKNTSIVY